MRNLNINSTNVIFSNICRVYSLQYTYYYLYKKLLYLCAFSHSNVNNFVIIWLISFVLFYFVSNYTYRLYNYLLYKEKTNIFSFYIFPWHSKTKKSQNLRKSCLLFILFQYLLNKKNLNRYMYLFVISIIRNKNIKLKNICFRDIYD